MVDGTYDVRIRIPLLGAQKAVAQLTTEGEELRVQVEHEGRTESTVGTATGKRFRFSGQLDVPTGSLSCDIEGEITPDGLLKGRCRTNVGTFRITGTRR